MGRPPKIVSQGDQYLILGTAKTPFTFGLRAKEDPTDAPYGSAQESMNITITDRGGIAPRPGELLIGEYNTAGMGIISGTSFKRASTPDILMRTYDDVIEYFNNVTESWEVLQDNYSDNKVFDFQEDRVISDTLDWLYFCNAVDPYSRWCGYEAEITALVSAGATTVPVSTTLLPDVFDSKTASAATTTTITIATPEWGDDIYNGFYVRITSGAQSGNISIIYDTTPTTITFKTIAGLAGTPTFEIRQIAVPFPAYFATSTASTPTTVTVAATPWQVNQWAGYYLEITSGAFDGQTADIISNTANVLTISSIAGLNGVFTFQIQNYPGPQDLQLIYNGDKVTYTDIPTDSSFTVTSAAVAADGDAITVTPQVFPDNPRGNILATQKQQMFVSGVMKSPISVFRSRLTDATDFTFGSPRAANEGDVQGFPFDGKRVNEVFSQEGTLYILKDNDVSSLVYTQGTISVGGIQASTDVAQINSIKQGSNVGTKARAWRMEDDVAFCTSDKRITTLGRVAQRDQLPQSTNIADSINRKMKKFNVDNVFGEELNDQTFIAIRTNDETLRNDIMLVRKSTSSYQCWESIWQVSASTLIVHNSEIYYGDSYTSNIYKLLTGRNKVRGTDVFPISAHWKSSWINARGTGLYMQEVSMLAIEGYITSSDVITFNLYKDFATDPFRTLQLTGLETQFQDNATPLFTFLGGDPLGIKPLGSGSTVGDPDSDGRRHFIAFIPFQQIPVDYIAIEVKSSGIHQNWEILKLGINAMTLAAEEQSRIKNS